jgi:hypothetical protein
VSLFLILPSGLKKRSVIRSSSPDPYLPKGRACPVTTACLPRQRSAQTSERQDCPHAGKSPFGSMTSTVGKQWGLDQDNASSWPAATPRRVIAKNDKPFHFAWCPQRQLRALIRVIIQTRVAHPKQMSIIGLSFDRVARRRAWFCELVDGARGSAPRCPQIVPQPIF